MHLNFTFLIKKEFKTMQVNLDLFGEKINEPLEEPIELILFKQRCSVKAIHAMNNVPPGLTANLISIKTIKGEKQALHFKDPKTNDPDLSDTRVVDGCSCGNFEKIIISKIISNGQSMHLCYCTNCDKHGYSLPFKR